MWGDVVHLKTMMLNFLGDTAITDAMIAQAMVVDRDTVNGDPEAGNTQPAVSPEVEEEVKQAIKEGEDQLKWDKGTINKPSMPDV